MKFLDFIRTVGNLKRIKRSGWVRIGVKSPESVADHVFRTTILALVLGKDLEVNADKLVKMSLVHDLAECLVGDLVVDRGGKTVGSLKDKHQKEAIAIRKIFRGLPQGNKLISLWVEYEHQETQTSKVLKELDKLEMALQALEYETEVESETLDEFWESARKYIQSSRVRKLFREIERERGKISK